VWNLCWDLYRADAYQAAVTSPACRDPRGPDDSGRDAPPAWDPAGSLFPPHTERRVIKGGSFLCDPSYCLSYRPSARRGVTPDTSTSHIGFRCAKSLPTR
jgi:formylglycine-generating enzyme required for sulfatase activity